MSTFALTLILKRHCKRVIIIIIGKREFEDLSSVQSRSITVKLYGNIANTNVFSTKTQYQGMIYIEAFLYKNVLIIRSGESQISL